LGKKCSFKSFIRDNKCWLITLFVVAFLAGLVYVLYDKYHSGLSFKLVTPVSRDEWCGDPPKEGIPYLRGNDIIVMHTADGDECFTSSDCRARVRQIQKAHAELKDIPYNFLIGSDGKAYEGRGFRFEGEHTSNPNGSNYNDLGIGIAFIGTFESKQPSSKQMKIFDTFIKTGMYQANIQDWYTIFLQDQLVKVEIPANGLLEALQHYWKLHTFMKIIRRDEWNARSPCMTSPQLENPINRLMLSHTETPLCTSLVRAFQSIITRHLSP